MAQSMVSDNPVARNDLNYCGRPSGLGLIRRLGWGRDYQCDLAFRRLSCLFREQSLASFRRASLLADSLATKSSLDCSKRVL
jgi:hypothetical protein